MKTNVEKRSRALPCGRMGDFSARAAALQLACLAPGALALMGCSGEQPGHNEHGGSTSAAITNGTVVPYGSAQYSYAAFLTITTPGGLTLNCSGSLVNKHTILTATHCTVCASTIQVTLIGEGSSTIHYAAAGDIHSNPAMYASAPPNCNLSTVGQLINELSNQHDGFGHDVAVVRIHPDADVTKAIPARVMLTPPRGFNPAVWSHEQHTLVTIVGRGKPSLNVFDLSVMRVGETSIDQFSNVMVDLSGTQGGQGPFFMTIHNFDNVNHSINLGGDSGGPMVAEVTPEPQVIGVSSAGWGTSDDYLNGIYAATFEHQNAVFLKEYVSGWSLDNDEDGDGFPNKKDNCPTDANSDQFDLGADPILRRNVACFG